MKAVGLSGLVAAFCLWAVAAVSAQQRAAAEPPAYRDPRSLEVVRFDCRTGTLRSELTLFANGTMRLREGEVGSESMLLSELDPDSLAAYLRRLAAESLDDGLRPPPPVGGIFTEQCSLVLDVPDGPVGTARFGAFDSLSLALSRVVAIVRELVVIAHASNVSSAGLSPHYLPVAGDVLIHRDGDRYRVQGLTSDGRGVELSGIEQPLILYVALENLPSLFLAVEDRR